MVKLINNRWTIGQSCCNNRPYYHQRFDVVVSRRMMSSMVAMYRICWIIQESVNYMVDNPVNCLLQPCVLTFNRWCQSLDDKNTIVKTITPSHDIIFVQSTIYIHFSSAWPSLASQFNANVSTVKFFHNNTIKYCIDGRKSLS